jgi:hypothetical protein
LENPESKILEQEARMRRLLAGLILSCFMLFGAHSFAQEVKAQQSASPRTPWKFELIVSEIEGGKVINARNYSMLLLSGRANNIRAGNQVPIVTTVNNTATTQYMIFGLKIDCHVEETSPDGRTWASVAFEVSSLAADGQNIGGNPVFRLVSGSSYFVVVPGKKEVVITADDINTNRQYQVAVIATRLN